MPNALDRLNACVTHESDEDQAEFARRVAAYRAQVLTESAQIADRAGAAYAARGDNDRASAAFALMEDFKKRALNAEQGENHVVDYDHDPASGETPECVDDCPGCEADRTVAYRNSHRPSVLLCREHGDGWWGLTALTSEDLPDGGTCTYGDPADPDDVCGRDVLAAANTARTCPTP